MPNQLPSFGFQSRSAQLSYPVLIFIMLLVNHFVYPEYPALERAEFALLLSALIIYVISRKFLKGPRLDAFQGQLRLIEKCLEVFVGVTVIGSLIHALLFGTLG